MHRNKIYSFLLVIILTFALFSACSKSGDDTDSAKINSKGLTIAMASTPETIDPTLNTASDTSTYLIHMFEGIMRYSRDSDDIEYGQAESHTVSADGLVWTFTLRDAKWSDGESVTADDFLYSWRRFVDPATAAPYAFDMGMYFKNGTAITSGEMPPEELGVRVIDERTIEITLEAPCPYFLEVLAFPTLYPVRRDTIEAHGDGWVRNGDTYITNGAFKMESFALDNRMVSVRNEHYWDIENIVPDSITWLFLSDDIARLGALRSGEAEYINSFPMEERDAVISANMYLIEPLLGTYYITFNHNKAPFDNVLVRKALTLAIDNAYIADVLRQGSVIPATAFVGNGFYTSGLNSEFRQEGKAYIDPFNYEQSKEDAKQALADAGYPNGTGFPHIEYLLNDGAGHNMIAEAIQQMWKDVLNINMEIRAAEWSVVLVDRREGAFDVSRNGWIADFNDPMTMLSIFTSTSDNNDARYSSPEYDALIEQSMRESDPVKRSVILHEAEDILMGQDWACAPIYYYCSESAANPNLKGFRKSILGYLFFYTAYMDS